MYIELQNAVKKYKSENVETLALNGISLGIDKGEMIAVAGPSGSGKTTLLNIIGGMDRLTEGKYLFQGEDTGTYNDKRLNTYRKEKYESPKEVQVLKILISMGDSYFKI